MAPLLALFLLFTFSYAVELKTPKAEKVLGKRIPDVSLILDSGEKTTLSRLAEDAPIIMSFIYTRCRSACPMIVKGIRDSIGSLRDRSAVILLIDFDLRDTPLELRSFRERHSLGPDWMVAIPEDGDSLRSLTRSLDFSFVYDEDTDMFAHPNVLVVVGKDLTVSGYFLGVRYDPDELGRVINLARLGKSDISPIKSLLLKCFRYDPLTGTYTLDWSFVAMVVGGLIPILGMAYFLFLRNLLGAIRRLAGGVL
jgi:protein SCO1/2